MRKCCKALNFIRSRVTSLIIGNMMLYDCPNLFKWLHIVEASTKIHKKGVTDLLFRLLFCSLAVLLLGDFLYFFITY